MWILIKWQHCQAWQPHHSHVRYFRFFLIQGSLCFSDSHVYTSLEYSMLLLWSCLVLMCRNLGVNTGWEELCQWQAEGSHSILWWNCSEGSLLKVFYYRIASFWKTRYGCGLGWEANSLFFIGNLLPNCEVWQWPCKINGEIGRASAAEHLFHWSCSQYLILGNAINMVAAINCTTFLVSIFLLLP